MTLCLDGAIQRIQVPCFERGKMEKNQHHEENHKFRSEDVEIADEMAKNSCG